MSEGCSKEQVCEEKFKAYEDKFKVIHHRLDDFKEVKDVLIELKLIAKQQVEGNEKRDDILNEQGKALVKMTATLEALSERVEKTDNSVKELKEDTDKSIKDLKDNTDKRLSEFDKDNNIKVSDLVKKVFWIGVTVLVTAIFTFFIAKYDISKQTATQAKSTASTSVTQHQQTSTKTTTDTTAERR